MKREARASAPLFNYQHTNISTNYLSVYLLFFWLYSFADAGQRNNRFHDTVSTVGGASNDNG